MKTTKLVIGIISIVLSLIVFFQSCAAGIGTALGDNPSDTSGGAGLFVAILMLVAGIVAVAARKSKGGAIAASVIYIIAGIIGVSSSGIYADLVIWGVLNLIFSAVFIVSIFVQKYDNSNKTA